MSSKKKLCPTCDGNVSYDAIFCPYCRSDLSRPLEVQRGFAEKKEGIASCYRPPYLVRESHGYGVPNDRAEESFEEGEEDLLFPEESEKKGNRYVWSLLLLSIGANLLILGLLIFFFAEEGTLTLEWKSSSWFIYTFASLPFFFLGWKCLTLKNFLSKQTETKEEASL